VVWIIIAVVVVLALGPLFWLLPSQRDRHLGELRTRARREGLVVEVTSLPKVDAAPEERVSSGGKAREPKVSCAAYRLALPRRLTQAPRWLLLKSERENRYIQGWTTLAPPIDVPPAQDYWREIGSIVRALPGGCVGVEADDRRVTWYGRERLEGTDADTLVTGIRTGLEAIGKLHSRLDSDPEE